MKIDISEHEQTLIVQSLELAEKSAKRAQTGKMPQIANLYRTQENDLRSLLAKIAQAK